MQSRREQVAIYLVIFIVLLVFIAGIAGYGIKPGVIYEFLILRPIRSLTDLINNFYSNAVTFFVTFSESIRDNKQLMKENARLKNAIASYETQLEILTGYYYENEELKNLLGIKNKLTFKTVGASIIFYDRINNFIVVDAGRDKNLQVNMPVIYGISNGTPVLVGRTCEVEERTARVMLINNTDFHIGVRNAVTGGIDIGEGNGKDILVKRYALSTKDAINDVFVTVEESNVFPPNIGVGKVKDIKKVSSTQNLLILSPLVDFSTIDNVLIVISYEKR